MRPSRSFPEEKEGNEANNNMRKQARMNVAGALLGLIRDCKASTFVDRAEASVTDFFGGIKVVCGLQELLVGEDMGLVMGAAQFRVLLRGWIRGIPDEAFGGRGMLLPLFVPKPEKAEGTRYEEASGSSAHACCSQQYKSSNRISQRRRNYRT